ncbi:hypothetical protein ACROYT_G000310 [Oculina patagonica]
MEESHRKVLQKLRLKISRKINPRKITEALFTRGILDENDRELVLAETTTQDKALYLLDLLSRSGPEAFEVFLQALYGCGCAFLVNAIQAELSGEQAGEGNEWKPRSVGLPRKVPKFVGRMDDCEEITSSMATDGDDMICLVTIVAPPGFGKTAVATNIGHMMLEQGKDVLYFSLRNVSRLTLAAEQMLKEVTGIHAEENPISHLTSYLNSLQRQTVLILDNAEDLQIGDEAKFEEFLEKIGQHAQNVVTLVTSRNSVLKLDLFPFGTKHVPLKPLTADGSSAYLKNHVPDISNQLAKEFATACCGVPLLLKITASFLQSKAVNPVDLHRKLQNCPHSFLKTKHAKIQELYSFLKVFYNNLRPDMKDALAYLASFPTSFTIEEAKDILFPEEDDLNFQCLLDDLVQHSLVQQDEDNNHLYYSLHPLVQAFCKSSRDETCTAYNAAIRLFRSITSPFCNG